MNDLFQETLFEKRYESAAQASEAARRSAIARAAGVKTPRAWYSQGDTAVCFECIDGVSGVDLRTLTSVEALLAPLHSLHLMPTDGLSVFDPLLRIDSRLDKQHVHSGLIARTEKFRQKLVPGDGAVHGDFHFGQLIRNSSGEVWLVDLDDLAIGPPEADLGNVIAHLATHPETRRNSLTESIAHWERIIKASWTRRSEGIDEVLTSYFLEVAVLRRALKLYEQGSPAVLDQYWTHFGS